jgi:hypothetical protein
MGKPQIENAPTETQNFKVASAEALPAVGMEHKKAIVSLLLAHVPKEGQKAGGRHVVTLATISTAKAALMGQGITYPMIIKTLAALEAEKKSLYKAACEVRDSRAVFRSDKDYNATVELELAEAADLMGITAYMPE